MSHFPAAESEGDPRQAVELVLRRINRGVLQSHGSQRLARSVGSMARINARPAPNVA